MNNKVINLILLTAGLTFGMGIRDFAALSVASRDIRNAIGPKSPTDTAAPTKPRVSEADAQAALNCAAVKRNALEELGEDVLKKVRDFIVNKNGQSLVLPSPDDIMARVFTERVVPSLMRLRDQKVCLSLFDAGFESERLNPWFPDNYKTLLKVMCGIEDTDTPAEVERKLGLINEQLIKEKMEQIIKPSSAEGKILRGRILDEYIRESLSARNLGLKGAEYGVVKLMLFSPSDRDFFTGRCGSIRTDDTERIILNKWKVESKGMSQEDYQRFGYFDLKYGFSLFMQQNPDGLSFKFKLPKEIGQLTEEHRAEVDRLFTNYSYIPVVWTTEWDLYQFLPVTKGTCFKKADYLFFLQVPNSELADSAASSSSQR